MKIEYITPLRLTLIADSKYQLDEPFYFSIDGTELSVPDGFITDFASVPRVPVFYLMTANKGNRAAVIHDWLYATGIVSREYADAIYYHALLADGVNSVVARIMYTGVRLGGASRYGKK